MCALKRTGHSQGFEEQFCMHVLHLPLKTVLFVLQVLGCVEQTLDHFFLEGQIFTGWENLYSFLI